MRLMRIDRPSALVDWDRQETLEERARGEERLLEERPRYEGWCAERGFDPDHPYAAGQQWMAFWTHEAFGRFVARSRGACARSRDDIVCGFALQRWLVGSTQHWLLHTSGPMGDHDAATALVLKLHLGHDMVVQAIVESRKVDVRHQGQTDRATTLHERISLLVEVGDEFLHGVIERSGTAYFIELLGADAGMAQALVDYWHEFATNSEMPADLGGYLAPQSHCNACGRPLRDEVSRTRGYGPSCAERWGIPRLPVDGQTLLEQRERRQRDFRRLLGGC